MVQLIYFIFLKKGLFVWVLCCSYQGVKLHVPTNRSCITCNLARGRAYLTVTQMSASCRRFAPSSAPCCSLKSEVPHSDNTSRCEEGEGGKPDEKEKQAAAAARHLGWRIPDAFVLRYEPTNTESEKPETANITKKKKQKHKEICLYMCIYCLYRLFLSISIHGKARSNSLITETVILLLLLLFFW